ncbi:MAG: RsiV family protein [Dysgonamonadaceae bacterium]|jgi:hypothetical protein|nr:RsiV family protein [Dysgonamonadaceae bacterium]
MNKPVAYISIGALLLSGLTSCWRDAGSTNNAIHFSVVHLNETHHLQNDTSKPACNIQIEFSYPDSADQAQLEELQNLFTECTFDDSFVLLDPQQVPVQFTKLYVNEFQQTEAAKPAQSNDEEEIEKKDDNGFACYIHLKNQLLFNQNGFISFIVEKVSYNGGARCSKNVRGYVYNLRTGKLLQEEDFAGVNYTQNLSVAFVKKLAEANRLNNPDDLENLGYNSCREIVPNNNFTVDNKGITYYFNEGEIGTSLIAFTQVFIPFDEALIYMKSDNPLAALHR